MLASVGATRADGPDPYLGTWKWPSNYTSTYKFDSTIPELWFRQQVTSGFSGMNYTSAANPMFVHNSTSTKGLVRRISNGTSCVGSFGWAGCALYNPNSNPSLVTWKVYFATQWCWFDGGSNQTCGTSRLDVRTVTLNEVGHVNTLGHHSPQVPATQQDDYNDAVVQAHPVSYPNTHWKRHAVLWADLAALKNRYGSDPCTVPPCPESADQ